MHIKIQLLAPIAIIIIIAGTSCESPTQGEVNSTRDNGENATVCDAGGELAMMAAPVVIRERSFAECGKLFTSLKTSIILKDDFHSLSGLCEDKLFTELYYSTDSSSLSRLESLASNATGGNFQLPDGIGRLVEARSLSPARVLGDTRFYIQPHNNYSPNRFECKVRIPNFSGDFSSQNVNFNSNRFRIGDIVYYKWAKRIQKESEGDPMRFSSETFSIRFQEPNGVNAGADKTITLPQERSVILNGNVVDNGGSIQSIKWKWIQINFGPAKAPTINSLNNPITEVIFNDFGNHFFELSAKDNCGNTYNDTILVKVLGQLNSSEEVKCIIKSAEACGGGGEGRNMFLKNLSTERHTCRIKLIVDLRSWLDSNTPHHGEIVEEENTYTLAPNQEILLGCSVNNGTGSNGSDRAYNTWRVIRE